MVPLRYHFGTKMAHSGEGYGVTLLGENFNATRATPAAWSYFSSRTDFNGDAIREDVIDRREGHLWPAPGALQTYRDFLKSFVSFIGRVNLV